MFSSKFNEAISFATQLHRKQTRKKTKIPYIAHLLSVAALVIENDGTEDEVIAALHHDSLEDQGADFQPGGVDGLKLEIASRFGTSVLKIVEDCSDTVVTPKPPWKTRKAKHLLHIQSSSASTQLVVAADKLHNLRSFLQDYKMLGDDLWKRFNADKDQIFWYYQEMFRILIGSSIKDRPLMLELQSATKELGRIING